MYWELTSQEHKLVGSSCRVEDNPYVPIGVLTKKYTVEECNEIRQKAEFTSGTMVAYWSEHGILGDMSLELFILDVNSEKYGQTIKDPVLIRKKDSSYKHKKKLEFPYARGIPISLVD